MAQQLFNRALLLAKIETVFRTDPVPLETLKTTAVGSIDSTADVTVGTDTLTEASHPFTTGELVNLTLITGAFPDATPSLAATTDYFIEDTGTNSLRLHTTLASATGTQPGAALVDLTLVQVGTFTIARLDSDAFLVIEPNFEPDVTILDRVNVRPHLSPDPGQVARKTATVSFQHEMRGNGVTTGLKAPQMGVLMRGCGFAETRYGEAGNTEETILDDAALPVNSPTGTFTYTKTTGFAGTLPRVVALQCTTPGASATAAFTVFSPAVGAGGSVQAEVNNLAQVMTDASPFNLAESAQITPTVGTSFAAGDTFVIHLAPAGHFYEPISTGFESLTLYVYFDGLRHIVTGCRGNVSMEANAGEFGTFSYTFQGDFAVATDTVLPAAPVFETTIPNQVELSNVRALGGADFDGTAPDEFNFCVQGITIDMQNEVNPRECINAENSLEGSIITGRNPVGTFNPETELEATHAFWQNLSDGERVIWGFRVGRVQGNTIDFQAIYAQYNGVTYANRNDIRVYDIALKFATQSVGGNDEIRIVFS